MKIHNNVLFIEGLLILIVCLLILSKMKETKDNVSKVISKTENLIKNSIKSPGVFI